MRPRTLIAGLALGRLAIGAALAAKPEGAFGAGWVGERTARKPAPTLLLRAVGARDAAVALGTLATLRVGGPLRPWLLAATLADVTDLLATFAAGDAVPVQGRVGVGVLAAGAAGAQLALVPRVTA